MSHHNHESGCTSLTPSRNPFVAWLHARLRVVVQCASCEPVRLEAETLRWSEEQLRAHLVDAYKLLDKQRAELETLRAAASERSLPASSSMHDRPTSVAAEGRVLQ